MLGVLNSLPPGVCVNVDGPHVTRAAVTTVEALITPTAEHVIPMGTRAHAPTLSRWDHRGNWRGLGAH